MDQLINFVSPTTEEIGGYNYLMNVSLKWHLEHFRLSDWRKKIIVCKNPMFQSQFYTAVVDFISTGSIFTIENLLI